jgi:hypothetical protein
VFATCSPTLFNAVEIAAVVPKAGQIEPKTDGSSIRSRAIRAAPSGIEQAMRTYEALTTGREALTD